MNTGTDSSTRRTRHDSPTPNIPTASPAIGQAPRQSTSPVCRRSSGLAAPHPEAAEKADRLKEAWLAGMRPYDGFVPMPRRQKLELLRDRWQTFLPRFGQLRYQAEYRPGRVDLSELRLVPSMIANTEWEEDRLAISVALHSVTIQPPDFQEKKGLFCTISHHACARRFQRGSRNEKAVLADLFVLAHSLPKTLQAEPGSSFEIPAAQGVWVGQRNPADNVLVVRTYLPR